VNDIADRNFDPHVERTRDRPLAAKKVSVAEAAALAGVLIALAFLLVVQLNRLTVVLSAVALFLALTYPLLKRFFWMPQAYLGVAFGFGIPMAFAAHQNTVVPAAWVVLAANVFWAIAYDTEYAMVDREDDRRLGLKSSAILFGRHDVLAVMVCHALFLGILAFVGVWAHLGAFYFLGIALAAVAVGYQYVLIRDRDRQKAFQAFLSNNVVGVAIFAGIAIDFMLRIPLF